MPRAGSPSAERTAQGRPDLLSNAARQLIKTRGNRLPPRDARQVPCQYEGTDAFRHMQVHMLAMSPLYRERFRP
jgi:hypothetical protein